MFRSTLIMAVLIIAPPPADAALLLQEDFSHYRATGLSPGGADGALDSLLWSVVGASDGDTGFGILAASGDFARGVSTGGVRTGGLYAFELPHGQHALGVQATGDDFTPGALIRRVVNDTGHWLFDLLLEADWWVHNDGGRSTRITLDALIDAGPWQPVPDATLLSAQEPDDGAWRKYAIAALLPLPALAPGSELQLRLGFDDALGTGGRDEIALSALRITGAAPGLAVLVAAPATAWLLLPAMLLATRRLRILNAAASLR